MKSTMSKNDNIALYRLCRDEKTKERLIKEQTKYDLPKSELVVGGDLFDLFRNIISRCDKDYALVLHDDVVVPENFFTRIRETIDRCDEHLGSDNWGVVGNSGVEFLSRKAVRFTQDPHSVIIPTSARSPRIVTHLDGNTLLLNLKNIREKDLSIPDYLEGFHLYDLVLVSEAYKAGLVCAVDRGLYVIHKSPGNQKAFNEALSNENIIKYFSENFVNHYFYTINGVFHLDRKDYKYLSRPEEGDEKDFYDLVMQVVEKNHMDTSKKKLSLVVRMHTVDIMPKHKRLLDSIQMLVNNGSEYFDFELIISGNLIGREKLESYVNELMRDYEEINWRFIYAEDTDEYYPRVAGLVEAFKDINQEDNSFVWVIDQDDFVFPTDIDKLWLLLNDKDILVGDSYVFDEAWEDDGDISVPAKSEFLRIEHSSNYSKALSGNNYVPICSVIYPIAVLKKVIRTFALEGDYFEDYALFVYSLYFANVRAYPIKLAGISVHGDNVILEKDRTHWDYSYATFLSEFLNNKEQKSYIRPIFEDYVIVGQSSLFADYSAFMKIKDRKFWKILMLLLKYYRKFINVIKTRIL
jgi:hypothetical protein